MTKYKNYIADCCHCDALFETWEEVSIHNKLLLPNGGTHTCRNLSFKGSLFAKECKS